MTVSRLLATATGGQAVPRLAKAGGLVIAAGLAFDLAAHTFLHPIHDALLGAFPLQEHVAHLVVIVGMVLVLAGVVADGVRSQRRLNRRRRVSPAERHRA